MWQSLRLTEKTSPDFVSSARELGQQTSSKLILTVGTIYLVWHFVTTLALPGGIGWRVWLVSPVMLVTGLAAWWLLPKRYLLAQVLWLAGLFATITLSVIVFQQPHVILLYAFLPLVTVITIGWQAGAISMGLIVAAMGWLAQSVLSVPLPPEDTLFVVAGGLLGTLLGWAASDSLIMVAYWSLSSYAQARDMTEEAQRNRGQLARVLRDLDQAYYRLQRANAALVVAWRTAAEAERFKAEFATSISHELRTPLNLIVGFSEMMMTSPESYGHAILPGPYRRDLNAVYTSAQHLLALVDDVIDLARIDAGRIALAREEIDLAALIREATNMVHDYVSAKGLVLQVQAAGELPSLWLDRLRIRQVLLNLLVNAARFTRHGSITVNAALAGDEVLVRVTDTGQGIPAQDLPRIFDEFRPQEDTGESPWAWHSGSGLGLPISKRFIEMHHGRMGVESVYQQGTTIWFALPRDARPAPGDPAVTRSASLPALPAEHIPAHPAPRLGTDERILVVACSDPSLPHLLQRHLDGYRVVGATSDAEVIGLVEELKPMAVLVDANADAHAEPLPLGDVPVIHCPLPSALRAAQALGAREMLDKPVSRDDLLAAIDRLDRPLGRVLIADDDPDMVRMFQRMLDGRLPPEACQPAYSGAEALRLLAHDPPDLVLLDLVMPDVDGYAVLKHMAANPALANIPVIVISAQARDSLGERLGGEFRLTRSNGFRLSEVTRTVEALVGAMSPGWN
jgi:signal transduction histidine kinase/CheY-like chemotaxis protein